MSAIQPARVAATLCILVLGGGAAISTFADRNLSGWFSAPARAGEIGDAPSAEAIVFQRTASFPVARNLPPDVDPSAETSAEIVAATADGLLLVYTDGPRRALGLVDIVDPAGPKRGGSISLSGAPTALAVVGRRAFVALDLSESPQAPKGALAEIDLSAGSEVARCALDGQPDALSAAPDGSFLAVAVENQRDERVNGGAPPQSPPGFLALLPLQGAALNCDAQVTVELTGLAEFAPEDPEPEFVDVNAAGEVAVTLQENNHVVIVSSEGEVLSHFGAGRVALEGVDATRDGALAFDDALPPAPREPDAVHWLGPDRLATANEGDLAGGTRGFTIFDRRGAVIFDSGAAFERALARHGHFPEARAHKKGAEPEGLEAARFDGVQHLFVGAERGSAVGVYKIAAAEPEAPSAERAPRLAQILPAGVGPEGLTAIPSRDLLVAANEVDLRRRGGAGAHLTIYQRGPAPRAYPQLMSEETQDGALLGWGALSGLTADLERPGVFYAVNDGFYAAQPMIFEIDAAAAPSKILRAFSVTEAEAPVSGLDLEGVAADADGGFWLLSLSGDSGAELLRTTSDGRVTARVSAPLARDAQQTTPDGGGLAVIDGVVWIALGAGWANDPAGHATLLAYDVAADRWGAVRYPLEPIDQGARGLTALAHDGAHLYFIERDDQVGRAARIKKVFRTPVSALTPAALETTPPILSKTFVRDLRPDLAAGGGYVLKKPAGLAIDVAGRMMMVTDNDGVDGTSGETRFMTLGEP